MKLKWTKQIPNKIGRYLFKDFKSNYLSLVIISKKDLQIQKECNNNYLVGGYYSEIIEQEIYEK